MGLGPSMAEYEDKVGGRVESISMVQGRFEVLESGSICS